MAGLFSKALPWLAGGLFSKTARNALTGTPGKYKQLSTLSKEQQPLQQQLINAGLGEGAGGAFGDAADYYRNNLSDNPADMQAFAAPQMRQFNEDIIPNLSEQFAGFGAGGSGLSGSGFRNAAINAGTDLGERLGAIRAQLRAQSAAGLQGIGQMGLRPTTENIYEAGQPGLLDSALPLIGNIAGTAIGGPIGGAIGGGMGSLFKNSFGANKVGRNTSPYGNMQNQQNSVLNASYGVR